MFKNYFKATIRSFSKHKAFTFINVFGLSLGVAMAILLGKYIQVELSYDQFFENKELIFRTYSDNFINGKARSGITGSGSLAPELMRRFPEIESAGRSHRFGNALINRGENTFVERSFAYADDQLIDILQITFVDGGGSDALSDPKNIIISVSTAQKVFNSTSNLVGKSIRINEEDLIIKGIFHDMPKNSHYYPKTAFVSNKAMTSFNWNRVGHLTYVKLKEDTNIDELEQKFSQIVDQHILPVLPENSEANIKLFPITDIWLANDDTQDGGGNVQLLQAFGIIGLLILLIATINYINLSTARSMSRVKEIGMRKVIGAARNQLIGQFLFESILMSLMALFFGGFLAEMCTGIFNNLTGKTIEVGFLKDFGFLTVCIGFGIALGFIAGLYPAFYISSFRPTQIFRSSYVGSKKNTKSRRFLVGLQFSISIGLIISTLVINQQAKFLINKDIGYTADDVMVVSLRKEDTTKLMRNAIASIPNVLSVTATNLLPATGDSGATFSIEDADQQSHRDLISMATVDHNYIPTMGFELVQGRNFRAELLTDRKSTIVNQKLVTKYGWSNPIGKSITMNSGGANEEFQIIGVVKDFNMQSLYTPIKPFAFFLEPTFNWGGKFLLVKLSKNEVDQTIGQIEEVYGKIETKKPFNSFFITDFFERVYEPEAQRANVFFTFSILTIVIACVGLFGLAAFVLNQKLKEISVRKVLGASLTDIISLTSKEFVVIIIISTLISAPISYYLLNDWLNTFLYRTSINIWLYVLGGLVALAAAIFTISIHTIKTARTNPAEILKHQ